MDSNRPKVQSLSTSSSTGYFLPIRAPLTHDSDFHYSKNSSSSSFTSDSDESEGFISGEDDFETASEILGGNENVVSRPLVKNVVEKEFQISDEEEEEDYTSPGVKVNPIVDIGVLVLPKFGMPICQLSADTDDDSVSSVVCDEDGFSVSIRVSNELELEQEEEDESYFEAVEEEIICVNESGIKDDGVVLTVEGKTESSEDVKYTVKEFEVRFVHCDNDKDKEVGEDKEPGSAIFKADLASESHETSPIIMDVEDIEMDIFIDSDAVSLNNLQRFEVEVKEVESNATNLNNQKCRRDIEIQESDNEILNSEPEADSYDVYEEGSDFDEQNEGFVPDLVSLLDAESSENFSHKIDSQIVVNLDEVETNEEVEKTEMFDSAAFAALFRAAKSTMLDVGSTMFQAPEDSRIFSHERATGLGPIIGSSKPTMMTQNRSNLANGNDELVQILNEEDKKRLDKIHQSRLKFLRFVKRLGFNSEDSVVAQVLNQLIQAAGGRALHQELGFRSSEITAVEVELEGKNDLRLSLNILVIGKRGVGKSATINSIFGEEKVAINAFESETNTIKEIVGVIDGVEIRVLDTPGLKSSLMEQSVNKKILSSIKKYTKKCVPDVLLYVDRVDSQTRDRDDIPLFKSITSCLGASIWHNTVVALTHAAATPPDGLNGSTIDNDLLAGQRSRIIMRLITYTAGKLHTTNSGLINPVAVVENHPSCKKNGDGDLLLSNGKAWRPKLMLLCYGTKILSELNHVSKKKKPDLSDHSKRGFRPNLSYILSSLLQSNTHPKLDGLSQDFKSMSDSDQDHEDEYDQLPPFKPLRKNQIEKLSKEQRNAYFEEYDYRVKLLQKKQLKEMMNKNGDKLEKDDQEFGSPSTVLQPLPDEELSLSFDGENPAYRYRQLESKSQIHISPVILDTDNWDHYHGYSGVSLYQNSDIAKIFPAAIAVQLSQEKKYIDMHLKSTISAQLGEKSSALAHLEVQSLGKQQLSCKTLKVETKFKNLKRNKTTAGLSVTSVGENTMSGFKIEDQLAVGKHLVLLGSAGAVESRSDLAYGTNLELFARNGDFLVDQDQGRVSLSLVRSKGQIIWGCNLNSKFHVGRNCEINLSAAMNNRKEGQISVKTSSSDQLQIAFVGLIAIARAVFWKMFVKSG